MKPKNEDITISKLGIERTFVSGEKNWRIEWAEIFGQRFKVGSTVKFVDNDDDIEYIGDIDWMIITESGDVDVSIANTPLGRIDLESLELIKI